MKIRSKHYAVPQFEMVRRDNRQFFQASSFKAAAGKNTSLNYTNAGSDWMKSIILFFTLGCSIMSGCSPEAVDDGTKKTTLNELQIVGSLGSESKLGYDVLPDGSLAGYWIVDGVGGNKDKVYAFFEDDKTRTAFTLTATKYIDESDKTNVEFSVDNSFDVSEGTTVFALYAPSLSMNPFEGSGQVSVSIGDSENHNINYATSNGMPYYEPYGFMTAKGTVSGGKLLLDFKKEMAILRITGLNVAKFQKTNYSTNNFSEISSISLSIMSPKTLNVSATVAVNDGSLALTPTSPGTITISGTIDTSKDVNFPIFPIAGGSRLVMTVVAGGKTYSLYKDIDDNASFTAGNLYVLPLRYEYDGTQDIFEEI